MKQTAILVGVNTADKELHDYEMLELKELCFACDIEVIETITQNAETINKATYVGKGKLEEIKGLVEAVNPDLIVCNDQLTPTQINVLQEYLDINIYDRTYVILEIFKRRATTKEAILQVDIASLRYMLPRLIGLREGLSRQRGGGGNGAYGRGAGETQLEIDRRNINDRIAFLRKQLEELTADRAIQRQKRKNNNIPVVCLVGYTNSGKSSTLNAFLEKSTAIKKKVMEKNMLFATLETSSRLVKLENNHEFILTDTVGFVSKLPTMLVEAFKSTLEEITEADLIVHVVDASNPNYQLQIDTTNKVLSEIGVKDIPMIYAFNKIDLVDHYFYIPPQYPDAIRISATSNKNIDLLTKMIEDELYKDEKELELLLPYDKMNILSTLQSETVVANVEYLENGVKLKARLSQKYQNLLKDYILK